MSRWRYFRAWVKCLLISDTGWLRWKLAERGDWHFYEPPEFRTVAPPIRRVAATLEDWWYGYFQRPTAWTYLKDEDRKGDLRMFLYGAVFHR